MIFMFCRNDLSDHVYLFLVVLLIFKFGRNNLSVGGVHRRFRKIMMKSFRNRYGNLCFSKMLYG